MNSDLPISRPESAAAIRRLALLAPLDDVAVAALDDAAGRRRLVGARSELLREGLPIHERLLILSGWAARIRLLPDGRRQVMSLLLPGELIGNCHHRNPLAVSTVMALTDVDMCPAPPAEGAPLLGDAYALSAALEEAYLLAQITRLGRLNAEERLIDLLLELMERLSMSGLVSDEGFALPLTQDILADMTGLTPVHVNRMLQLLRSQGDILLKAGQLSFDDAQGLARRIGRSPVRVAL
jgi:CRP-like cAMP-binding protein